MTFLDTNLANWVPSSADSILNNPIFQEAEMMLGVTHVRNQGLGF